MNPPINKNVPASVPAPAPNDLALDVRGLFPPEPMERVLDALAVLAPGQAVRMLIDREPHPLYRILERNDYRFHCSERAPGDYEVVIWTDAPAA